MIGNNKITLAAVLFYGEQMVGGGGRREWKREVIEIIQVRDDSCLDRGVAGGSAKTWTESGYILKVEPTRFPGGLDVICEQVEERSFREIPHFRHV